ncbi:hypothetical protein GCM10027048_00470 [Hymenobacter coalescens]
MPWLLGLLLAGGLLTCPPRAEAAPAFLDSLRRLPELPPTEQLRLARRPVTPATAPTVIRLTRLSGLPRLVLAELLANLAGHYLHENQPSLAVVQMLQTRQMGLQDGDSARYSVACEWLCYAYALLHQPRLGLRYGHEALRAAPGRGRAKRDQLASIYSNLATCAELLPDYPLATRYYRRAHWLAVFDRDSGNIAVAQANLAAVALKRGRYAEAASLLDSAHAVYPEPRSPGAQVFLERLAGELAQRQGNAPQAVERLQPALHHSQQHRLLDEELTIIRLLVPALATLGQHREALGHQQRLAVLQDSLFEANSARHAQELRTLYETEQYEQQLARQRQRIAGLKASAQQHQAELNRRNLLLVAGLLGASLLLALVVVRQRARNLLTSTAEALRMRSRIAADLHDEVGTLLTRINLQAEMLRQAQPAPDPALERLLANSRQAAGTMRDIVWGIDAEADTVGALLDRMRDHLDQTAAAAGLATELHVHHLHDEDALRPDVRQHLFLIFKEAVSNAARHAHGATCLHVTLAQTEGELHLRVTDNGTAPAAAPRRSGLGLRSMQQRATALRGWLSAGALPAGGFEVSLRVPT